MATPGSEIHSCLNTKKRPLRGNGNVLILSDELSVAIMRLKSSEFAIPPSLDLDCHHATWLVGCDRALPWERPMGASSYGLTSTNTQSSYLCSSIPPTPIWFAHEEQLTSHVLSSKKPRLIADMVREAASFGMKETRHAGFKSGFKCPVLMEDQIRGALDLLSTEPGAADDGLVEAIQEICLQLGRFYICYGQLEAVDATHAFVREQAAAFLASGLLVFTIHPLIEVETVTLHSEALHGLAERNRLEQELKREQERVKLLLNLSSALASHLDLPQVFEVVSAALRRVLRPDAVVLALPELGAGKIRHYAVDFPAAKGIHKEGMLYLAEGSISGYAFRTGKSFLFNGMPDWLNSETRDILANEGLKSGCALPLIHGGNVLGVLILACFRENAFTQNDVDILDAVSEQLAIALENAASSHLIAKSRERLVGDRRSLPNEICQEGWGSEIIGNSLGLKRVLEQVETVAETDATVLILGETGTGKTLIARAIHNLSQRRDRSFVIVNCASIPPGLLESELFGHEKGAFTGATGRQIGRFELANEGTLFLDEVGDIPLELQPKLLRVLQEREFERVGSTRTIRADCRLVAATSRDLDCLVEDEKFRRDLYYRLNVFPIQIPSLRERREDIPPLVHHFVSTYAERMNKRIESIPAQVMEALTGYDWPGNIRELQNLIERAVILSPDTVLHSPLAGLSVRPSSDSTKTITLEEADRAHIARVLQNTTWVIGGPHGAAAQLGLKRTTLLYKMHRLGIHRPQN